VKTKLGGQHNRDRNGGEIFGCPKKHPEKHQFEEVWKNPYKINKHLLRLKVFRGEANSHLLPHQVYVWRISKLYGGEEYKVGPITPLEKKTVKPIYKGIDKDNKKDLHIFLLTILFY